MLIRIMNHHVNNPRLIDKLIVVKGLPEDWIFRRREQGMELLRPWEPDADVNIPHSIRHLCDPIAFCHYFPPINTEKKTFEGFWDTRTVLGLRLDYSQGPGQEMWDKIEEFIDRSISRFEKMPEPVVVAKDQLSAFETYLPKRAHGKSLELIPMEVPVVDLRRESTPQVTLTTSQLETAPVLETPALRVPPPLATPESRFSCKVCGQEFKNAYFVRKHGKVHAQEKVVA